MVKSYFNANFRPSSLKNEWIMVNLVIFGLVWFYMVRSVGIVRTYFYEKFLASSLTNE